MPNHPRISIVILNWNGKRDTLACLHSLQQVRYPHFDLVVVDNGSTDDSVAQLRKQYPQIRLIENEKNLGFSEGNNRGIRFCLEQGTDLILLLNNDTIVDPEFLNKFASTMNQYPECGILGAKIYLFDQKNTLDHLGGKWDKKQGLFQFVGWRVDDDGASWEKPEIIDYVCGAAMLIRREVFEKIGLLEPKFFLLWEESDFCFRAKKAGFLSMICPQAKIWHKVHASFVGGKAHSTYFNWRNRLLWIERNCPWHEILSLFIKLSFSILKIYKLKTFQCMQIVLFKRFIPQQKMKKKQELIHNYRAALQGAKDYALRRFGDGPSWIYKRFE